MQQSEIKEFLDLQYQKFNCKAFVETDPVQVPRLFSLQEDIEIAGFLTATFSWGQRKTIIAKSVELMRIMDFHPYDFLMQGDRDDIEKAGYFCHRTFNGVDAMYFLTALKHIYTHHGGLGELFRVSYRTLPGAPEVLERFRKVFFEIPHPVRTMKHIPDVRGNAAAKRLNMFLRWMVRADDRGVDIGIWKDIGARHLMIPLDVHTGSVARKLGLLKRKQNDWQAVVELTGRLREFDPDDPVKYDFALFGLGAFDRFCN